MLNPLSPDERERALRHLEHGASLALERFGERATHQRAIWALIEEAIDVTDRLPDQERSWLTAGARAGGIKAPGMSRAEAEVIENLRLMSAMKPHDGASRFIIQRDETDRAMDVLLWLRWLNRDRRPRLTTRATIALARGGDTEPVYRILFPGRKVSRQALSNFKTKVIGLITSGLRDYAGIVPAEDLTFKKASH